ncbi:VQ motif-containing protein 4-like [Cicer arietinum]|uniref:VQ motif-containing protein 4-like n=1 Tax=Cicer arietinum TaxID=3827 RepID=A0A1S2YIQ5_CICAR|nr:VQ motif-containing protein 4-like [Cicer arietinum]
MDSNKNMKSPGNNSFHHHPSLPSPRNSHNANASSSNNNGGLFPQPPSPSLFSPKPTNRSESGNPYPTTFVQADVSSFKQVVQMLTGSNETVKHASSNYSKPPIEPTSSNNNQRNHIPPIKTIPKKHNQQSGYKLYERRNSLKNFHLNPLLPVFSSNSNRSGFSPRNHDVLSPSILDFPSLVLSPVTPLIPDPFNRSTVTDSGNGCQCGNVTHNPNPILNSEAEDKAIKEKGFFLHPSPRNTPRGSEPKLLPLFPTTSPKASAPSSSSTT